jgi:Zinc dependent phospholipase C
LFKKPIRERMPGPALHLRLASEVLDRLPLLPSGVPFPVEDGICRLAFLMGSNAPDMGYYPGGNLLLSDLAHYIRSADLARNMIRAAETGPERAFAWGWVTHILADVWIHPLINRRAGELLRGPGGGFSTYANDPLSHVRIEAGLDGYFLLREGPIDTPAEPPGSIGSTWDFLAEAYRQTYGARFSTETFLRGLNSIYHFAPLLLKLGHITGTRFHGGQRGGAPLGRALLGLAACGTAAFCSGSPLNGLTHPLKPPPSLVEETSKVINAFAQGFHRHYVAGLSDLPNYNLDTGETDHMETPYRLAGRAMVALRHLLRQIQLPETPQL